MRRMGFPRVSNASDPVRAGPVASLPARAQRRTPRIAPLISHVLTTWPPSGDRARVQKRPACGPPMSHDQSEDFPVTWLSLEAFNINRLIFGDGFKWKLLE
nr:hypothetical protein [Cressdnaviricota sp.]UOF77812.1 hypothetical protein [Cressdnaviricota sp.]UOF78330.1 hypothetical protein [Cressdnaviricota sp.]UOF80969.1 hypothetical protein [Cressdnaviricota sp.]UOF82191.1 hypothetical protein [Cressdnaviricota sp.]